MSVSTPVCLCLCLCLCLCARNVTSLDTPRLGVYLPLRPSVCAAPSSSSSLTPWYDCGGTINSSLLSQPLTASFRRMHCQDTLRDVRHWMCFVPKMRQLDSRVGSGGSDKKKGASGSGSGGSCGGTDVADLISSIPPYELPDGTLVTASADLTLLLDQHLFTPSFATTGLRKTSKVVHELFHGAADGKGREGEDEGECDDGADLAGLVMQAVSAAYPPSI